MALSLIVFLPVLVLCQTSTGFSSASDYSLVLLGLDDEEISDASYQLVITNLDDVAATITIDDFNHNPIRLDVAAHAVIEHTLGYEYGINGSQISNKTVHLTSNALVQLQVFSITGSYVEGFLGLPRYGLDGPRSISGVYEYVTTTFCALGGFCQIGISVFEDDTNVHIYFPSTTDHIAICSDNGYFRSRRDRLLKLNKFQSVQFESASDLSGVHIYSKKPISVFVGSRNMTKDGTVAHIVEQLHPTSNWGTEYVVGTLGETGYGDVLKISTQWTNTVVDIKGLPVFVVSNRSHNIWRRLDLGDRTYIKASRPIQVVQITGLAYASANDHQEPSMVVVPAIENGDHRFVSSCGLKQSGKFYVATEVLSSNHTIVDGATYRKTYDIPHTFFTFWDIHASARDQHSLANTATIINVIVKCRGTATMPLGLVHRPVAPKANDDTRVLCKELIKGSSRFLMTEKETKRHEVLLGQYTIITLRVRTCGSFTLQFLDDFKTMENYTMVTLFNDKYVVRHCYPNCQGYVITTRQTEVSEFDCIADMLFYWFRLEKVKTGHYCLCVGYGPFAYRSENTCNIRNANLIPKPFVRVLMVASPGEAVFNYDLETEEDCDFHESEWRCEDKTSKCSDFGLSMCSKYPEYSASHCAKYCHVCIPDSIGRKFIFSINQRKLVPPPYAYYIKLVVQSYSHGTNIAAVLGDTVLPGKRFDGSLRMFYNIGFYMDSRSIVIISDADVTVAVIGPAYEKSNMPIYVVYPVDTFGKEYLAFQQLPMCRIVSQYSSYEILPFETKNSSSYKDKVSKQKKYSRDNNEHLFYHRASITSDKPFGLYCSNEGNGYWSRTEQQIPTEKWGNKYFIPPFKSNPSITSYRFFLILKSNRDNTVVTIDGDFDALHILYYRGDEIEQEITGRSAYTISASHEVAVVLVFKNYNEIVIGRHIIPPYNGMFGVDMSTVHGKEAMGAYFQDSYEAYISDVSHLRLVIKNKTTGQTFAFEQLQIYPERKQSDLCHTSISTPGDKIDNDCDGLPDEDICFSGYGVYGDDYDLDGGFGEDCCCQSDTNPILGKPTDPTCIEIIKPANQCWTICDCNCGWLNNLEHYDQMTDMEKEVLHETVAEKQRQDLSLDQQTLSAMTSRKISVTNQRRSATNIGYVGIALLTVMFGTILMMDIKSLVRDLAITFNNLKDGADMFTDWLKRSKERAKRFWQSLKKIKDWISIGVQRCWQVIKRPFRKTQTDN